VSRWAPVAEEAVRDRGAIQKPGELAQLLALLGQITPEVIIEIGCDAGGTLWAWSQLPGPPRVIGVDLPGGPFSAADFPQAHGAELIIGDSHHRGTLARVRTAMRGELADVLFVDGDHTYRGVAADYHTYRPLVRPGGLIVFHDIIPHPQSGTGVAMLWEEVAAAWPSMQITEPETGPGFGIGILVNEPLPVPEPVRVPAR
jgi:cephalosporin hydroxylase